MIASHDPGHTRPIEPVPLAEVLSAHQRIARLAVRTPLLRLEVDRAPTEIYLKLENLQPIGSFKLRGLGNALLMADEKQASSGVWTASAGNAAQGLAWPARRLGFPCTIVVPEGAAETKLAALRRLGARIVTTPYDVWWQTFVTHHLEGQGGLFVHAFANRDVMAGNGTIGIEILQDLPDVDAIVVPFGGGGLICGIASAIRMLKPEVRIYACEVETAAPLAATLAAGSPQQIQRIPSFVDGIGGVQVLPVMWPLVRQLVDDSITLSLQAIADVVKLLVTRNCVVTEGAGAASVAAALQGDVGGGKVVCVLSGGNIDPAKLAIILQDGIP
jgi:threonine dehydratase